jgi:hypothetical protein
LADQKIETLRAELKQLKLSQLKARARAQGLDEGTVDDFDDQPDPKMSIIEILLVAAASGAEEAAATQVSEPEPDRAITNFSSPTVIDEEIKSITVDSSAVIRDNTPPSNPSQEETASSISVETITVMDERAESESEPEPEVANSSTNQTYHVRHRARLRADFAITSIDLGFLRAGDTVVGFEGRSTEAGVLRLRTALGWVNTVGEDGTVLLEAVDSLAVLHDTATPSFPSQAAPQRQCCPSWAEFSAEFRSFLRKMSRSVLI